MFDELAQIAEQLERLTRGLSDGVARVIQQTPLLLSQQIESIVSQRTETTTQHYMTAVQARTENSGQILIIELDPDDWLANAVESGTPPWDMHDTHLRGPKVRYTRSGYKYKIIPIQPNNSEKGTEQGTKYKWLIQLALQHAKWTPIHVKVNLDGTVQTTQRLITSIPEVQGLYRTRRWKSAEHFQTRQHPIASSMVMFRTISNSPANADKWHHPGITPIFAFPETQRWVDMEFPNIIRSILEEEIAKQMAYTR